MCPECEKVETIDSFLTPKAYLNCLKYIPSLVDGGSFRKDNYADERDLQV